MNTILIHFLDSFHFSVCLRLLLAVVIGGLIGTERSRHGSAAGLRTHILVCVGAVLTSLTGLYVNHILGMGGDVLRLSAQVISGIGFLGTGMIVVKNSNIITGLTTAAGMWATAAIGIALGCGFYIGALLGTLACVVTTALLSRLERKSKMSSHNIYTEVSDIGKLGDIADRIRAEIDGDVLLETLPAKSGMAGHIGLNIIVSNDRRTVQLRKEIESLDGVVFSVIE
ncbi:MAG: MgtC/SapB family protein [Clostridia bacterium]|nr:MgtC/SapB family protein [Clostridia bacterium]